MINEIGITNFIIMGRHRRNANLAHLGPLREFPQRFYTWKGAEPADMGRRGERVVDAILAARDRGITISPGYRRKRVSLEERMAQWLKELGLIHSFSFEAVAKDSGVFVEFPDNAGLCGFDRSDRKFFAVALASKQSLEVLNAVDSGRSNHHAALKQAGVAVVFLCPQHVCGTE